MGSEYYKVATSIKDSFVYLSGGTPVTGKVQADFTRELSKNGVGNQSVTGITITEEDSVNNAGKYDVDISGATGFVAGTGTFDLVIYLTATPADRWTMTYIVTSDGTGAGTWGDASFEPTAADGRVVVAGLPLADATVRITDSNDTILVQHTTDTNGLYSRTYFSANGTYTIHVQKSGYTVATASITVSGATATGPGSDITLTALSTSSGLLVSTLMGYTRRVMMDYDGSKADAIILEVINDAAEYLSMTKQWPYYHTRGVIDLQPTYSTGSVSITNGSPILTLTSGTWPTWAALGEVFIDSTWVEVLTRDSATQLTLVENWGQDDVSAGSYTIAQMRYALPDDCARTNDLLLGKNWPYPPTPVSAAWLEMVKDAYQPSGTTPAYWAVEKNYILIMPPALERQRVNFLYFRKPVTVTASDTLDFDATQLMLLRRCIDYHAAMRGPCTAGSLADCKNALDEALSLAYSWDKTTSDMGLSLAMPTTDWLRGSITP